MLLTPQDILKHISQKNTDVAISALELLQAILYKSKDKSLVVRVD